MDNTVLCVRWGDKYDDTYVKKLKEQLDRHLTVPFNFYCLTDNPKEEYDIQLPTEWDEHYRADKNMFWAYRKCYMFNEDKYFPEIKGTQFLYFDIDILIHNNIDCFFDMNMKHPYIVRGWWNDAENCRKNFGQLKSTPLNSSCIRWTRGQLRQIEEHIETNKEVIFFTYRTIDNYFNHFFYNIWEEGIEDKDKKFVKTKDINEVPSQLLRPFPKGWIYSWYKGNIFPDDMETKKLRKDLKICLFNNSYNSNDDEMPDIEEIKKLW